MIIQNYQLTTLEDRTRVSCQIVGAGTVYFEFDSKYSSYISEKSCYDALMIIMLPYVMKIHEPLIIKGIVSEKLYYNLRYVMKLISITVGNCRPVQVKVDGFESSVTRTEECIGTGLSCGVDSLSCLEDHYFDSSCLPGFKLTHVANLHTGGSNNLQQYRTRLKNITRFIEKTDLNLLKVESNITQFCKFKHLTIHPLRTGGTILLFQNLFKKYYYSSAYSYSQQAGKMASLSHVDPILIPLLSTENLEMISFGCQYTRTEKLLKVSKNPLSYSHLDVCVDGNFALKEKRINCSRCMKCLRTMFILDHFGRLSKYHRIFNIGVYRKHFPKYKREIKKMKDPIALEIRALFRRK